MNKNNPWEMVPLGDKAPEVVNAIVDIPKGSTNKYEFNEELGVFKLDRVLFTSFRFPLDYGFIPQTRSEDGDHLDVFVIGGEPVPSGFVVDVRPIAILDVIDSGEPDAKILGVQAKNPQLDMIKDLKDIEAFNPHLLKEIVHFLEHYKDLQGKKVETKGWKDAAAAKAEIKKAAEVYAKEQAGK